MSQEKTSGRHRRIPTVEQWIEVYVEDGKTITEFFPPNDILREEALAMDPAPELVYRRILFLSGVPPEYDWTFPDNYVRENGGGCIQRLLLDDWLDMIQRETYLETGHIGPSTRSYIPRPNERGGCECPACARHQHVLEELGYSV